MIEGSPAYGGMNTYFYAIMMFSRCLSPLVIYLSPIPNALFSQHWHLDPMSAGSLDGFLVASVGMAHNS